MPNKTMPQSIDVQSDEFFKLLTDALRAGPGSPEWRDAVGHLRDNESHSDELRLLVAAREHLESGKAYGSVRAGPNFTRKVMEGLDRAPETGNRAIPIGRLVFWASAAVIVGVLIAVGRMLMSAKEPASAAIDELAQTYFVHPSVTLTFDGSDASGWKVIGPLSVDPAKGLRTGPATAPDYTGGGLLLQTPIPARSPFAFEVSLRVNRATDDVIPEVFVTDQPDFSTDRAVSSHELAWLMKSATPQVALPDGRVEGSADRIKAPGVMPVRIVVGPDAAIVVFAGKRIWAGAHGLDPDKPRYVGVRFLKRGPDRSDSVLFVSARVMKP